MPKYVAPVQSFASAHPYVQRPNQELSQHFPQNTENLGEIAGFVEHPGFVDNGNTGLLADFVENTGLLAENAGFEVENTVEEIVVAQNPYNALPAELEAMPAGLEFTIPPANYMGVGENKLGDSENSPDPSMAEVAGAPEPFWAEPVAPHRGDGLVGAAPTGVFEDPEYPEKRAHFQNPETQLTDGSRGFLALTAPPPTDFQVAITPTFQPEITVPALPLLPLHLPLKFPYSIPIITNFHQCQWCPGWDLCRRPMCPAWDHCHCRPTMYHQMFNKVQKKNPNCT